MTIWQESMRKSSCQYHGFVNNEKNSCLQPVLGTTKQTIPIIHVSFPSWGHKNRSRQNPVHLQISGTDRCPYFSVSCFIILNYLCHHNPRHLNATWHPGYIALKKIRSYCILLMGWKRFQVSLFFFFFFCIVYRFMTCCMYGGFCIKGWKVTSLWFKSIKIFL